MEAITKKVKCWQTILGKGIFALAMIGIAGCASIEEKDLGERDNTPLKGKIIKD